LEPVETNLAIEDVRRRRIEAEREFYLNPKHFIDYLRDFGACPDAKDEPHGDGARYLMDWKVREVAIDPETGKVEVVKEALNLEGAKADAFWPVYRKYQLDLDKIGDKRIALIKEYAANFDSMTDAKAKTLVKQALDLQTQRTALLKNYYGQFEKVIGSIDAAKLVQVEHLIMALVDVQLAAEMPLIEKPAAN